MSKRVYFASLMGVLVIYAALAGGHARTTPPWCDEAWLADPAFNLLQKGQFGTPVLTPFGWGPPMRLEHIREQTYWIMPLHSLAQVTWYRLLGFSLWTLRALSIAWGALALCALALLVDRLTGDRLAALGAAALAGLDYFVLTRAADGRMDMMSAALGFSALAVYSWRRSRKPSEEPGRALAAAAVLAAASAFTHPVGGFFTLVALGFLALYYDGRRLRIHHLLLAAMPYLVGLLVWGLYINEDVGAFRAQMGSNAAGRLAGLAAPWTAISREITDKYLPVFGFAGSGLSWQNWRCAALVAYAAGVVAVFSIPALRRERGIRALALLTLVAVVSLALFDGAKRYYYLIYTVPLLAAVLASVLAWVWRARMVPRPVIALGLAALLTVQLSGSAYRISRDEYGREYAPMVEFVRQAGGERVSLIGGAEIGFGLNFPDTLTDDVSLGYVSGARPALIFVPDRFYRLWFHDMQSSLPAAAQHIQRRLTYDYRKVYDHAGYEVYARRDFHF